MSSLTYSDDSDDEYEQGVCQGVSYERTCRLRDTIHETPVVPIHFNNPSDELFARLFVNESPDTCIPWKYYDMLLSALRDASFDPKEITFKNSGDMFSFVGRKRDEGWSAVESRSGDTSAFPQAVLEAVFDLIKDEMEEK